MKTIQVKTADRKTMRDVYPVIGMTLPTGVKMVGFFLSPEDARSEQADSLALGTINAAELTEVQIAIAEANSDEL